MKFNIDGQGTRGEVALDIDLYFSPTKDGLDFAPESLHVFYIIRRPVPNTYYIFVHASDTLPWSYRPCSLTQLRSSISTYRLPRRQSNHLRPGIVCSL